MGKSRALNLLHGCIPTVSCRHGLPEAAELLLRGGQVLQTIPISGDLRKDRQARALRLWQCVKEFAEVNLQYVIVFSVRQAAAMHASWDLSSKRTESAV